MEEGHWSLGHWVIGHWVIGHWVIGSLVWSGFAVIGHRSLVIFESKIQYDRFEMPDARYRVQDEICKGHRVKVNSHTIVIRSHSASPSLGIHRYVEM